MYCPKCHHEVPDQVSWCPWCGVALWTAPAAPKRRRGGLGTLLILLICTTAAVVWLRAVQGSLHQSVEAWGQSNQGRGDSVQTKDSDLGSAGYLRGDVLLVSIYVSDSNGEWDKYKQTNAQSYLQVACDFLEKEAAGYGQELELYYDGEKYPNLIYQAQYGGRAAEDRSGAFTRWIYRWIDDNVPVADLQKSYGTENIGFLMLIAGEGGSYTNVYYVEDSKRYYNENSVLFYYYPYVRSTDREVPGVYAHEILHMFGAIDLYEESPDFSPENIEYVSQTYPNDIMYGDYVEGNRLNYTEITLEISPVTAYYLGWLEELPQADQEGLREYERTYTAGFSYEDPTFGEE